MMPRDGWLLASSDEEDDESPHLPIASFTRQRWMRHVIATFEDYCFCFVMPAMCMFAVYALIVDHYASETFLLSTNSSLLLQPNPFLIDAVEVQVVGEKQGPKFYGFTTTPELRSEAAWTETHNVLVEMDQFEALSLWLNKGSLLNVTCAIRQPGFHNLVVRVLQERKSTRDCVQDFTQQSELLCQDSLDQTFLYSVPRDGHFSIVVENLGTQSVEVFLSFQVHATLYTTKTAVYLCIPFPQACELQISFFGNKAAVLTTPTHLQTDLWKAKLSYKVRWLALAIALGGIFFITSTLLKLASQLHLRRFIVRGEEVSEQSEEEDSRDYEQLSEEDASADNAFCVICLNVCKDSFFIPCGHSTTCLPCGQGLKSNEGGVCPKCKEPIEIVNQLFHV